jgi:dTDP-4-dehydrorhamnose 3,5-epimerase
MPKVIETELEGTVLLEVARHGDDRGWLAETFRADEWREAGIELDFVQENHSRSVGRTLRGLHFQTSPGQAKLVRCARGVIWDVAVDLRAASPTFGRWEGHELSEDNGRQLLVPVGFAHGFCVLSEMADVIYRLSSYYDPVTEAGFAWDDPEVGVEWPVSDPILSDRDREAPQLAEIRSGLPW